ncbi:MAG: glycogen-binding domain-containing protein [Spirochaetes bacterium]|nr:glycogen-binding domain-containing protein [Spirochaetota bacterium]
MYFKLCKIKVLLLILFLSSIFLGYIDFTNTKIDENNLNNISKASEPIIYSNGVLFTYSGPGKIVKISGSFFDWQYMESMKKSFYDIWYYFLKKPLKKGFYVYKFNVDNFWILDPNNSRTYRDNNDHQLSLLEIPKDVNFYSISPVVNNDGTVTFWMEDKGQKFVHVAGSFNNWNPFEYLLYKEDGFWKISLKLKPGRYFYRFIIDYSKEIIDPNNPNIGYDYFGKQCSYFNLNSY